jgi:AcrR family transcriptional regulator
VPKERDILRRGLEAFAELGYDRASARELARRLGVSHNFIHDRYGSKAAFWRAVVDAALDAGQRERMPLLEADTDDVERLRSVITHFYRGTVDTPLLGRIITDECARETDRLDHIFQHYLAPTLAAAAPAVDRLVAAGRMAPVPMDVLYFAVIGPIAALVQTPLARRLGRPPQPTAEDRRRMADQLAGLVLDGLLIPGAAVTTGPPSPILRLAPSTAGPPSIGLARY